LGKLRKALIEIINEIILIAQFEKMKYIITVIATIILTIFAVLGFQFIKGQKDKDDILGERSVENGKSEGGIDILEGEQELVLGGMGESEVDAESDKVKLYTVRDGDTLASIAQEHSISINTLIWANDISEVSGVSVGDTIFILPVSGLKHKVLSSDTIKSIAEKYSADTEEILAFNDLPANGEIKSGQEIIIPGGSKNQVNEDINEKGSATENALRLATRLYFLYSAGGKGDEFVEVNSPDKKSVNDAINNYAITLDSDKSKYIFTEELLLDWEKNGGGR